MSAQTEQIAILGHIKSFWNETTMGPLIYPNSNRRADPKKVRTAMDLSHTRLGRQRSDLGSPRMTLEFGNVLFVVHMPVEGGTLQISAIYDVIRQNMDEWRTTLTDGGTLVFDVCQRQELGQRMGSYRTNIICPFRLREIAPSA